MNKTSNNWRVVQSIVPDKKVQIRVNRLRTRWAVQLYIDGRSVMCVEKAYVYRAWAIKAARRLASALVGSAIEIIDDDGKRIGYGTSVIVASS